MDHSPVDFHSSKVWFQILDFFRDLVARIAVIAVIAIIAVLAGNGGLQLGSHADLRRTPSGERMNTGQVLQTRSIVAESTCLAD